MVATEGESEKAVIVTGAGSEAANGLYIPTGKTWHEAPVFENDRKCLLSREPHRNQKTGETSFGWILGQDRRPLYAVQSESLTPPTGGWRKFSGTAPAPQAQALDSVEDAAQAAGQAWKEQGNRLFAARRYEEAEARWTRALGFVETLEDSTLKVALYSNRAEARLRRDQHEGALGDAQAALQLRPAHDKALLRAAVAARELRRLDLAHDFVCRCLEAQPEHLEAQELVVQLEQLLEDEQNKDLPGLAKSARSKLQDSLRKEAAAEDASELPKAFSAKDRNSRKGFKAFEGYSEKRAKPEERPPLSALPYHNMGLPQDQVDLMDNFFKEMREKRDERQQQAREEHESYEAVKREYREEAARHASDAPAEGRPPPEGRPPATEAKTLAPGAKQSPQPLVRASLPQDDARRIDALFVGHAMEEALQALPASAASEHRERLDRAKELVTGKAAGNVDRRSTRERQLDEEEAQEQRQKDLRVRAELQRLKVTRRGEPTRLEQAGGELYCWWCLPAEIGGREISVKASQGGTWLAVTVRGVAIFDRALFAQVRADDVVWSVDDGELHVTLTKAERNKLWEQLGEVPSVQTDEGGKVLEESLPEPLSASDRVDKFQQMVTGDDGVEFNYDDLDSDARRLVDTIRRYRHAKAVGDNEALSLAECDLQEFGKLVI